MVAQACVGNEKYGSYSVKKTAQAAMRPPPILKDSTREICYPGKCGFTLLSWGILQIQYKDSRGIDEVGRLSTQCQNLTNNFA